MALGDCWKKVTDECYPTEDTWKWVVVVKIADEWYYFTQENCPYGWNSIEAMEEAYWMEIPKPDFIE